MGKLSKTFYANIGVHSFCVTCPLCHRANTNIDIFEDDHIIIYPEERFRIIKCEGCDQILNVLATQIFETDLASPAEAAAAIANREAFTHPKRVRELEFALWSLSFTLHEEKPGQSSRWPPRIREALARASGLVSKRDEEFRALIDDAPNAPLFKDEEDPASRS